MSRTSSAVAPADTRTLGMTSQAPEPAGTPSSGPVQQRSRDGKVLISGFFEPETRASLKNLAFMRNCSQEELLREALMMLFDKHANALAAASQLRASAES